MIDKPQTVPAALIVLSGLELLLGCAPRLVPCRAPTACGAGQECLANRCLPLGAEPVPPGSGRAVVEPSAVAVVGANVSPVLPPTVTFGGEPAGEQLLLRFPRTWGRLEIEAAFLLLEPARSTEPSGDVPLQVSLAATQWASGALRNGPAERAPSSFGLARTRPPSTLRIDVTELLLALRDERADSQGLLVRAADHGARAATYLTGVTGGAPRLEVYGRLRRQR